MQKKYNFKNTGLTNSIRNFPIGGEAINKKNILSKATIISYLARYQEIFDMIEDKDKVEEAVRNFFKEQLELADNEFLPEIDEAIVNLNINPDCVYDCDKVEYIKDLHNPHYDLMYRALKVYINMENLINKSK